MTICDAIAQVNAMKPNTYSIEQKVRWLSRLEAMVKRLVIDAYEGGENIPFEEFTRDTDQDTTLFMPAPFDAAYLYWLEAHIHYTNEDIDMYNSAMMMFNSSFEEYKAYYRRNHVSKGCGRFRF